MTPNDVAHQIVDSAFHIHSTLGPGLFESVYETILASDLETRSLTVARQHPVPITWQGIRLEAAFKADLIIHNLVIVELKSVETITNVHKKQLLTYLRLADKQLKASSSTSTSTSSNKA